MYDLPQKCTTALREVLRRQNRGLSKQKISNSSRDRTQLSVGGRNPVSWGTRAKPEQKNSNQDQCFESYRQTEIENSRSEDSNSGTAGNTKNIEQYHEKLRINIGFDERGLRRCGWWEAGKMQDKEVQRRKWCDRIVLQIAAEKELRNAE